MLCDSYISDLQKMHTYNLCDSCMGAMRFMHNRLFLSGMTDSVMRLPDSLSFVNRIHESSKKYLRIVVNLPHYPKYPVNYPFVPLTANLDMRITTRIGSLERIKNESRKSNESGTNREMRTNQERIRKTERIMNCDIFATDPPQWKLRVYPLQWKLRVDPHSGN